jgi:thioredoxin-like negative regulator of GroEL
VTEKSLLVVFFTSERSGPARRMESVLAHVVRKERNRLRVICVDADEQADLAGRFHVEQVPTLVVVGGHAVVGRLEGRASAPRIESLLASCLQSVRAGDP